MQPQLAKQQQVFEAQQQQLQDLRGQLQQLKDLHQQKLARLKEQLQQQYEAQLEAAAAAYTQELALAHVSMAEMCRQHESAAPLQGRAAAGQQAGVLVESPCHVAVSVAYA
jgi:peptidoglycan hydrolase CwlO-like protein